MADGRLQWTSLETDRRRLLLRQPAMRPLAAFAERLRAETGRTVLDADPCDGGVGAGLLLLLERPGRGASTAGFVSRDNTTPTARNIRRLAEAAGLPRDRTLIWNAVPWTDDATTTGNRAPKPAEIRTGLAWLPPLLALLPRLQVIVLAGRVAAQAETLLRAERPDLPVLSMPHPSPTILCTSPRFAERIFSTLTEAASHLQPPP